MAEARREGVTGSRQRLANSRIVDSGAPWLIASCITNEVDTRLKSSNSVDYIYLLTDITLNKKNKEAVFVNKIREVCGLINRSL